MPRSDAEWERWYARRKVTSVETKSKSTTKLRATRPMRASTPLARVIGEKTFFDERYKRSKILEFADYRRANPTPAERELSRVLQNLNGGVLRGQFVREHVISGKWIVDFFFSKIRLAIEVDGSFHLTGHQIHRDRLKDADCAQFDITVLRVTNSEVFGPRDLLTNKLRAGWREALHRDNRVIGLTPEEYSNQK